ncbi:MAG: prephenate dehydrogenase [Actinomycetota bacterium]
MHSYERLFKTLTAEKLTAEKTEGFHRIAIIGTGLMGGSLGLALAAKAEVPGGEVFGFDRDPECLRQALASGAVTHAASDLQQAVNHADLVVLATPVETIPMIFAEIVPHLQQGTVVTDIGSTKKEIVEAISKIPADGIHFIGGHPLAGSERQGIDAASPSLYAGAFWILTPTDNSDVGSYGKLVRFLTDLDAQVLSLDPARHDASLALSSHLPQLISSTLMAFASEVSSAGLPLLAAGGFRDMTRLASSPSSLWIEIVKQNRHAIMQMMLRFSEAFQQRHRQIENADWESLKSALDEGKLARDNMASKPGVRDGELVELVIEIPDRPGALAEVTTTLGEARINIEDLAIVHSPEGGRGVIHLFVGDQASTAARHVLGDKGFVVA